ncbi:MAG: hypothetical protein A2Y62_07200 [Candidatus Fischerbacteria bacterium RBG_13_37_8]|uniref:Peptidase M24 domain-containing protein n=1 Tax=Candidatus Fischerbacteria bacterium RBG_13_37_8 TaxID=1817863 RepID=A0A1F5VUJ5_9BACT|nr:MAG: hypothetical protein A2Y62_07200 [Candidatus Fischerbacteria bacterium RBG_13_37_8]
MSVTLMMFGMPALLADTVIQESLPVGLEASFSLLYLFIKTFFTLVAIILLIFGHRFPRFTTGFFLMLIGVVLLNARLSSINYLLSIGAILIFFIIFMGAYLIVPRVITALMNALPFVLIYGAYLLFKGSFSVNYILLFGLMAGGVAIGAVLPRFSLVFISTGLGTLLLTIIWESMQTFWLFAGLMAFGVIIQAVDFFYVAKKHKLPVQKFQERKSTFCKDLTMSAGVCALVLIAVLGFLAIFSPQLMPGDEYHAAHLEKINKAGLFNHPGFIFSKEYNFYLFGEAIPVSLVGKDNSFFTRLKVLFIGRSPSKPLTKYRAIKDDYELGKMRQAGYITSQAFKAVGEVVKPGINEKELADIIEQTFIKNGATGFAFKSTVGSGANALLPHYELNNAVMKEGFVVVDIGCMVDGYSSDMTRTFPVMRTYTEAEMELMKLVVKAKEAAVKELKPGASLRELNKKVIEIFKKAGFEKYYLHSLGHHVGIEVHDPHVDKLEPGMVVTIEPGLYISEGSTVDKKYWNLGLRIEDTYVITKDGCQPLTNYAQIP